MIKCMSLKEKARKCFWSRHIYQDFTVLKARVGVRLYVLFHTNAFLFIIHFFLVLMQTKQSVLKTKLVIRFGMLLHKNVFCLDALPHR